jgi:hypothetical protein
MELAFRKSYGGVRMKKIYVILLALVLLASGSAWAEDGFKIFVGYSVGQIDNSLAEEGTFYTDVYKWKHSGLEHGLSVDARYEGGSTPIFVRATFDYNFLPDVKETNPNSYVLYYKGHFLMTELDLGYKLYKQGNFAFTPYAGIGYLNWKISGKTQDAFGEKYSTPYAAAGAIVGYTEPKWSISLDAAFLLPFSGKYSWGGINSYSEPLGVGARVQLPVTYSVIPKKGNAFGLMLFAAPFYKYIDPGKSDNFNEEIGRAHV